MMKMLFSLLVLMVQEPVMGSCHGANAKSHPVEPLTNRFLFLKRPCDFIKGFANATGPGTHDPEPTTLLCSCNGVFTDRFTFRLNFPRMRLPQEPDDQLQEIKLSS